MPKYGTPKCVYGITGTCFGSKINEEISLNIVGNKMMKIGRCFYDGVPGRVIQLVKN